MSCQTSSRPHTAGAHTPRLPSLARAGRRRWHRSAPAGCWRLGATARPRRVRQRAGARSATTTRRLSSAEAGACAGRTGFRRRCRYRTDVRRCLPVAARRPPARQDLLVRGRPRAELRPLLLWGGDVPLGPASRDCSRTGGVLCPVAPETLQARRAARKHLGAGSSADESCSKVGRPGGHAWSSDGCAGVSPMASSWEPPPESQPKPA
mmetsp:Transcript_34686/g.97324  ORF Transcript_34686/g.97324 Transcript_34686/m.97324 type:complete len:208 (+) Transcript_34686:570-1193(+)